MEPEFLTCSYDAHRASGSIYPKDKIPIELFHRKTKDGGFQLLKTCLDCRTYINISKTKTRSKRKQNVQHQLELIEKEYPNSDIVRTRVMQRYQNIRATKFQ